MSDLVIAFDADDTLWHNEPLFTRAHSRFREILARYPGIEASDAEVYARESRNIRYFGYGSKGFTLSLIETAIELTRGEIVGRDIQSIIDLGKEILDSPLVLIEGAAVTVASLAATNRLFLITKGDALEQEGKIARSGLAEHFSAIEIVAEKDKSTYERIFRRHGIDLKRVLMVGNSLRSDVLPVVELGGMAAHVPYETTWQHEVVAAEDLDGHSYHELAGIRDLAGLVDRLDAGDASL